MAVRQLCCSDQLQIVPLAPAWMGLGAAPGGTGDTGIHQQLPAEKPTGETGLDLPWHNLAPVGISQFPQGSPITVRPWLQGNFSAQIKQILPSLCTSSGPGTSLPCTGAPPSRICQPGGCQSSILGIRDSSDTCCPKSRDLLILCHARTS